MTREEYELLSKMSIKERAKRKGWDENKTEKSKLILAAYSVAAAEQKNMDKFESAKDNDWVPVGGLKAKPGKECDIKLRNGSIIIDALPQSDRDYYTRDITGADLFISEHMVTHYRVKPG